MATIIAFPRATTPRRETLPPLHDYSYLRTLSQIRAYASGLRRSDIPAERHRTASLSERLRAIADELDQLCI